MKFLKELIPYIIIVIVVVIIRTFLISPAIVNGDSMLPILKDNEIVFVNKYINYFGKYKRFDIVVIKEDNEYLIKRLIGFEGETVEYRNDELYINNEKIEAPIDFEYTKDFKEKVDENSIFVLGDNRNVSKDSRYFGSFNLNKVKGTVNIRIFPFNKIGKVE